MTDTVRPFEPIPLDIALRQDAGYCSHAKGCKKALDACKPCKLAVAWYAGLPLPVLSLVLQDRPKAHRS